MNSKINFDIIQFKTEEGNFILLNTEFSSDSIELTNNIIYIKRKNRLFETSIISEESQKFEFIGKLDEIDHFEIFNSVFKYNLVKYNNDMMYLWKMLDAIFNTQNITILEEFSKFFKLYANPYLFKIIK